MNWYKCLIRLSLIFSVIALFLAGSVNNISADSSSDYSNTFEEQEVGSDEAAELNPLIYQAIGEALPDVNLQGYNVTATTKVKLIDNAVPVYKCVTVATLSNKSYYQTEVIRVVAECSTNKTYGSAVNVLRCKRNYIDPQESADYGGVGGVYSDTTAQAVLFAPEPGDPTSQTAATKIKQYFATKGISVDMYKASAATEAVGWQYVQNGGKLCAWWHLAHGITADTNGAPCYGYKFYNSSDRLYYNEFRALTQWQGLDGLVAYMNGCNTYMNPIRNSVIRQGHNVRTYIAGKRLMPFNGTADTDKQFWYQTLKKEREMGQALTLAQAKTGLTNYYGIWGDSSYYFKVLLLQNQKPWGTYLPQKLLKDNKVSFIKKNSSVMATEDFSKYDVIIIAGGQDTTFYNNFNASLTRFQNYVNGGGILEIHDAQYYSPYVPITNLPGGVKGHDDSDSQNVIVSSHRLVDGVPDPFTGSYASHGYFTNLPSGATVITQDTSGRNTLIEYYIGEGIVVATTQPLEHGYQYGYDTGIILNNMIPYNCGGASYAENYYKAPALTPANPPKSTNE